MKYHLIWYDNLLESENKVFKFVRKMALVPYQNQNDKKINSGESDFYRNYRYNKALAKTLNQPANVTVLSNLSREIVDISNDNNLNDDQRVSNYIHAIKRYLIFRDKVFNLTPVVTDSNNERNTLNQKKEENDSSDYDDEELWRDHPSSIKETQSEHESVNNEIL